MTERFNRRGERSVTERFSGSSRDRAPATRAERAAAVRSRRARKHLERMRGRREQEMESRLRPGIALALSIAMGLVAGRLIPLPERVAAVAVSGAQHLSITEVAHTAGLAPGADLAALSPETLRTRLLAHPWISGASTLTLPTGRVVVHVDERRPAAVLAGAEPWAVDRSGTPFAAIDAAALAGLPRLVSAETHARGEADADLAHAVALADRLPELGLALPSEVGISAPDDPEGFSLVIPGVAPRVVLGRDDLDNRLGALARLLAADLPELASATRLDLRFQDQAVLDGSPSPDGAAQAAATRGRAAPPMDTPTG